MSYTDSDHDWNATSVVFHPSTPPHYDTERETRPTVSVGETAFVSVYRDTDDAGHGRLRVSVDIDAHAFDPHEADETVANGLIGLPVQVDMPGGTVWAADGHGAWRVPIDEPMRASLLEVVRDALDPYGQGRHEARAAAAVNAVIRLFGGEG